MKILRVINSLQIGGAERSIATNVPYHVENGIEMDVLLLDGQITFFKKSLEKKGVRVYSLGNNQSVYNPFLIFKLCKFIKQYDIVHGHLFPVLYWLAIAKIISRSKTKMVFTEHSTENRRRSSIFFSFVDKIMYNQYDAIIAISQATYNKLVKNLRFKNKIFVINNGVDIRNLKQQALVENRDLVEKYKAYKIVLKIAGFRPEKDQDTVIRALSHLPENYIVFFVGDGVRRQFCEQLVDKHSLNDRVLFLGIQDNVGAIIKMVDIVVASSHWEGFGRLAVEGMALGKPVIATDVDGLREVVLGAGLLFKVGDDLALSKAILSLEDKEYYQIVADRCEKRAKEYDISSMIEAYESVYYDLVKKKE